ncbi:MAG: carboxylesterase/lipase family protein, partial [Dehalococcoidia bacterium]
MTIVETTCGRVEGIQREGQQVFCGIPYAAPPTGDRRWRAPEPHEPWAGLRPAKEPGFAAPQTRHPIPGFAASGPRDEGCLFLDIFTPAADAARRPVLFWIHGGGFTHGAASEELYDGGHLARRGDVVVVGINYRLGALGYLWLGDILPDRGLVANAGQLDQIAALRWVHDNIAAFGGDPGNVTIFGESAGAAAVGTLLAMPAAAGLFHRAILQSGTGRASSREAATKLADSMLAEFGIERSRAEAILTAEPDSIVEAQTRVVAAAGGFGLRFGPVVDDESLLQQPVEAVRAGRAAGIPVIAGTNRDEVKLFVPGRREPIDDRSLLAGIGQSLPNASADDLEGLIRVYRTSRAGRGLPNTNLDLLDAVNSDIRFRLPATRFAAAQRAHQPKTHMYLFTRESPARGGSMGSCHALEIPFVFGSLDAPTQDRFAGTGPEVEALSSNMMEAWLSFARSSSPGHEGIGHWPAYDAEQRATMVFDSPPEVVDDPLGEERRALA